MTCYTKIGVNNNDFYIICANIGITRNTLHHNQFNTLHLNQGYATNRVNTYNLDLCFPNIGKYTKEFTQAKTKSYHFGFCHTTIGINHIGVIY